MWVCAGWGEWGGGTQILPLFQATTSKSVEAMIGSRVSREFVNHSEASLAERKDGRLSGVGMMDGCSRWVTDERTKEGNDASDFFSPISRGKSRGGDARVGRERAESFFSVRG